MNFSSAWRILFFKVVVVVVVVVVVLVGPPLNLNPNFRPLFFSGSGFNFSSGLVGRTRFL